MVIYCLQSNVRVKNHAIVMPDANEDATLNALAAAGFGAAGQKCMALSMIIFVGGYNLWYYFLYPSMPVISSFRGYKKRSYFKVDREVKDLILIR